MAITLSNFSNFSMKERIIYKNYLGDFKIIITETKNDRNIIDKKILQDIYLSDLWISNNIIKKSRDGFFNKGDIWSNDYIEQLCKWDKPFFIINIEQLMKKLIRNQKINIILNKNKLNICIH